MLLYELLGGNPDGPKPVRPAPPSLIELLGERTGSLPTPNIPDFSGAKKIGVMDGYDIWAISRFVNLYSFGIKDAGGETISYVHISMTADRGAHDLREAWTREDYRGKNIGLATIILTFLMSKLDVRLWIRKTEVLSNDSRGLLIKMINQGIVRVSTIGGNDIDRTAACNMLKNISDNDDEFIIHESPLELEIMSDKHFITGSVWHTIKGVGCYTDLD